MDRKQSIEWKIITAKLVAVTIVLFSGLAFANTSFAHTQYSELSSLFEETVTETVTPKLKDSPLHHTEQHYSHHCDESSSLHGLCSTPFFIDIYFLQMGLVALSGSEAIENLREHLWHTPYFKINHPPD